MIHGYWVSGHKVKVCMVENDPYKIISHTNDIFKLFPEMDISHLFTEMKFNRK